MTQKRSRDESARTTQPDHETEPREHTEDEQVAQRGRISQTTSTSESHDEDDERFDAG
ncbi:hypothetical protein [Glutamicibacter soli]|uniref:hypothetical protein n=1 Tax=Glutamicibacter soli TaxID=453836 RepID=UPI0015EEFF44|nr:hypothetical protein [Glutamicibacter soli]